MNSHRCKITLLPKTATPPAWAFTVIQNQYRAYWGVCVCVCVSLNYKSAEQSSVTPRSVGLIEDLHQLFPNDPAT